MTLVKPLISVTVSAINSPITFCQSHPPTQSVRSTHQSHSASLTLRHGQCDQLTNHILPVSPSDTVSAINSPITFCQSHPPTRSCSAINSPITFCQSHPPTRSMRSTHQSHSASLTLRHGQCDQLTNHILPVSPSDTVSAINSPITFCQSHPPTRPVRSTHQSHSASLTLRHGQCDQLTNHILPVSPPSRSVRSTHQSHSASLTLRHGQSDQLINHILSVSPPSRSVRSTHQSHSANCHPPPRSVVTWRSRKLRRRR